jgi:hypothetical protein
LCNSRTWDLPAYLKAAKRLELVKENLTTTTAKEERARMAQPTRHKYLIIERTLAGLGGILEGMYACALFFC